MNTILKHLSYANIVSTLCLFSVLGGTAYAAATINGASLKNNTVTSAKIKNLNLTGSDIKNSALTGAKIKDSSLTAADLAPNSVAASEIAANGVGASEIGPGAVAASELATGAVSSTHLAAEPFFHGRRTTDINIASSPNGLGVLPLETAVTNLGGFALNGGNTRITVPRAGRYAVTAEVDYDPAEYATIRSWLQLRSAADALKDSTQFHSVIGDFTSSMVSGTTVFNAAAGDEIRVLTGQDSGSTIAVINVEVKVTWLGD